MLLLTPTKAINMNIAIMRAFVAVRQALIKQNDIKEQLKEIKQRIGEHDVHLNQIYDAMENLLDDPSTSLRTRSEKMGRAGKDWFSQIKP